MRRPAAVDRTGNTEEAAAIRKDAACWAGLDGAMTHTPTRNPRLPRRLADFETLAEGLDYAARGDTGLNFFSGRGALRAALPYAQLRAEAVAMARGLVQAGVPAGARMVLLAETDPNFVIAFLACQYAGIIPVPVAIPTVIGGREAYVAGLRRQIASCGAQAAMAPAELVPYLEEAARGRDMIVLGGPDDIRALPGGKADLRPFGRDDLCYLQYSSGSTRHPQGIAIAQRTLMANCHAIARYGLQVGDDDRCVSWLPFYHDMGLVGFMLTALLT
ncbi:MAG: hypothetical protein D6763_07925, partial [Alphaproteobacteria bacterium]